MKAICTFCDKEFEARRKTARFCTDKHRVAYNRQKWAAETIAKGILWDLGHLTIISKKFPELQLSTQFKRIMDAANLEMRSAVDRELNIARQVRLPLK